MSLNDDEILNKADDDKGNDEGEYSEKPSVTSREVKIRSPRRLKLFIETWHFVLF